MLAFVVVIQRFFAINAMSFRLSDNSLNDFPAMLIEISNAIASCYLKYSKNFRDLSSMPATLCNAKFATAIRSRMDEPGTCGIASPLCTSSVASRIHYSLQNESPKIMHMLCKTKHVETKPGTFFKCTSTLFKRIHHLPLSIPNARSTNMCVELSNGTPPVKDRLCGPWRSQHLRPTWVRGITNQSGPTPNVGIVHRNRPTYVKILKQTFRWHHTLQKNWIESFAVVVIWSMQSGCNDGYMRVIHNPYHVGNLMQVLEILCIFFYGGRRRPIDEFSWQNFF